MAWVDLGDIYCLRTDREVIYDNSSGADGTITFNLNTGESIDIFKKLEITYTDGTRHWIKEVPCEMNMKFSLYGIICNATQQALYFPVAMCTLLNSGITIGDNLQGMLNSENYCEITGTARPIKIQKVIGCK